MQAVIADIVAEDVHPDEFGPPLTVKEAWIQYCKRIACPCREYFFDNVVNHPRASVFEAAALANPDYMRRLMLEADADHPVDAAFVRAKVAPLVGKLIPKELLDQMVKEISAYKSVAKTRNWEGVPFAKTKNVADLQMNIIEFWSTHRGFSAWRKFAHLCFLLQPSSAAVERAFSFLKYIYDKQSKTAKQDLIETTLKLRYNSAKRLKTVKDIARAAKIAAALLNNAADDDGSDDGNKSDDSDSGDD